MSEPTVAQAVMTPDGMVLANTIRVRDYQCRIALEVATGGRAWEDLEKDGYKVVRVEIRVIDESEGGE